MNPGVIQLITAIFGPMGVIMGAVGVRYMDRHKTRVDTVKAGYEIDKLDAEAAAVIASTAVTLVKPLQQQITELVIRVDTLERENIMTVSKLQVAINHIRDLRAWIGRTVPSKDPPPTPSLLEI